MNEKRMIKVNAFMLKFVDTSNTQSLLTIRHDHHAEQILRGLVHSGFEVTIKEIEIEVESDKHEKLDYGDNCEPTSRLRNYELARSAIVSTESAQA